MDKYNTGTNKSFGIVFFLFFLIVSIFPLFKDEDIRVWSLIVAIIFLILGLLNSRALTPFNILWFKFGLFLGKIVSPIIMGLVFFLVVTPTGIIMRLFNKDLLNLKKKKTKSYWIIRDNPDTDMKNQF
jgi:hypothetical protein